MAPRPQRLSSQPAQIPDDETSHFLGEHARLVGEDIRAIHDGSVRQRLDIHDNLFEIGASSLKLIEIHEQIDREYPGKVDLTELFDFPTIAELAQHLQSKLAPAA